MSNTTITVKNEFPFPKKLEGAWKNSCFPKVQFDIKIYTN